MSAEILEVCCGRSNLTSFSVLAGIVKRAAIDLSKSLRTKIFSAPGSWLSKTL